MAAKEKKLCCKCNRVLGVSNFYRARNGDYSDLCKKCETMFIEIDRPEETVVHIFRKLDYPYIPSEWEGIIRNLSSSGKKFSKSTVFGRYISRMCMVQYIHATFKDSIALEEKALTSKSANSLANDQEALEAAYKAGDICEAEYLTYKRETLKGGFDKTNYIDKDGVIEAETANDNGEVRIVCESLKIDGAEDLDEEDIRYLKMKWGSSYTNSEWIWLEQKYTDFASSFEIEGAARVDTLIFICKTSLKMHLAMDAGDLDDYTKLSKTYDSLMKSAKFTEQQKDVEEKIIFTSVGKLVYLAEKEGGKIEKYKCDKDLDSADRVLSYLKNYLRELIEGDSSLNSLIENYIRRRERLENEAKGEKTREDQDYQDFNEFLDEEEDKDLESLE